MNNMNPVKLLLYFKEHPELVSEDNKLQVQIEQIMGRDKSSRMLITLTWILCEISTFVKRGLLYDILGAFFSSDT